MKLNITYDGRLHETDVLADTSDEGIRNAAREIIGVPVPESFVIERFPATEQSPDGTVMLRPKVPFGSTEPSTETPTPSEPEDEEDEEDEDFDDDLDEEDEDDFDDEDDEDDEESEDEDEDEDE